MIKPWELCSKKEMPHMAKLPLNHKSFFVSAFAYHQQVSIIDTVKWHCVEPDVTERNHDGSITILPLTEDHNYGRAPAR